MPPRRPRTVQSKPEISRKELLSFIAVCPCVPDWKAHHYGAARGFDQYDFVTALNHKCHDCFIQLERCWWDDDKSHEFEFQNFNGFTTAAQELTPQDIDEAAATLRPIWLQNSRQNANEECSVDIQAKLMRAAIAFVKDGALPDFSSVASDDEAWHIWARNATKLIRSLFNDSHWSAFAACLPALIVPFLLEQLDKELTLTGIERCSAKLRTYICEHVPQAARQGLQERFVFWQDFMSQGQPKTILAQLTPGSFYHSIVSAIESISENREPQEAADIMTRALKTLGSKRSFEHWFYDWIYGIALYRDRRRPESKKKLARFADSQKLRQNAMRSPLWIMSASAGSLDIDYNELSDLRHELAADGHVDNDKLLDRPNRKNFLVFMLTAHHFGQFPFSHYDISARDKTILRHNKLLALEVANELEQKAEVEELKALTGLNPLLPPFTVRAEWEKVLDRLFEVQEQKAAAKPEKRSASEVRILYQLEMNPFELTLKLQKRRSNGWTKGTDITYNAFHNGVKGMTEQDRSVADCLRHPIGYANRWEFNAEAAILALVGSPNVVDAKTGESIEIEQIPLQIVVKPTLKKGWIFDCNLEPDFDLRYQRISYYRPEPGRIVVIAPTSEELNLLRETQDVEFPTSAKERLTNYLESLSRSTPVLSSLVKNAKSLTKKAGDSRITFRIQPTDDNASYTVSAFVRPVSEIKLTCEPGKGLDSIAAGTGDKTVQVARDLRAETANFDTLIEALANFEQNRENQYAWQLSMLECLRFLEVLHEHADRNIIEWPQGVQFTVSKSQLRPENLELSVMSIGNWLSLEGKLRLDAKTYISVGELLEKLRQSQSNFIRLSDKEYVALTASFKKQIEQLDSFASQDRKGNVRVSVFNAELIENLKKEGIHVEADQSFNETIERIKAADRLTPVVPSGLRAELRSYQVEGFEWLSRLSSWGAGALLADDMGLGKTLQTIALLLARANLGPALVVMPAAVLYNWASELKRFAPSLNVKIFNTTDRRKIVKNASANDVVLSTYGVMSSEIEQLKTRQWTTLVLDEAHAIKNRETKMSKAALQLQSSARVLLTGTPLQNHLSEIWNLFELANPGLLGSFTDFSERFIVPIEKNQNRDQQRLLKRLISPFILRRTKAEVLDELPEKTEITLRVTLSKEERALYENLRERASEQLEAGVINPIEALAELTKLRQAACHPALIDKSIKIESSKTSAFLELAKDLIEGRHRALVFSQFTSHLALIRAKLDELGIQYLYLDGSTPAGQRQKLVDAFQQGDMPLFLISLKAGGTGLNLTAADYVIHLDPWWNPAIEDQASDRSYRIGQDNPVTIYRLIAEDTIEEKILRLHATKKSLADALLEGSNMSNRLSKDEILKLLSAA